MNNEMIATSEAALPRAALMSCGMPVRETIWVSLSVSRCRCRAEASVEVEYK